MPAARLLLPPVYALTDRAASGVADPVALSRRLFALGVRALQLRDKAMPDRERLAAAEAIAGLARDSGRRSSSTTGWMSRVFAAPGVHLGDEDLSAADARGDSSVRTALIGVSTHDPEAARRAFADRVADYVAFGPVFDSSTKTCRPARGLEALARAASCRDRPLVAIGGITVDRLDAVWDAGADSAAMIGGLYAGGRIEDNVRAALDRGAPPTAGRGASTSSASWRPGRARSAGASPSGSGAPFVDLDDEIERKSGRTVRALFEEFGEAAFRESETAFLAATESLPRAVIATGGGCFSPRGEPAARRAPGDSPSSSTWGSTRSVRD